MRFSAPRSTTPSPERPQRLRATKRSTPRRSRSTFGIHSDSESEDSASVSDGADDDSKVIQVESEGSDGDLTDPFQYISISPTGNPLRPRPNPKEARRIEETVAAIRLHTRHHDPYEDWEIQTRRDAFRTARKDQTSTLHNLHSSQSTKNSAKLSATSNLHASQLAQVAKYLSVNREKQQRDESQARQIWADREKSLWDRVESGIRWEQARAKEALRLEVERLRQDQEAKLKAANEATKAREEEVWRRAQAEEEAKAKEEAKEAERLEKEREIAMTNAKRKAEKAEEEEKKTLGLTTADEDWGHARTILKELKSGPMKNVKANKPLKSAWSALRRQITPKIGQLTNDAQSINNISRQLHSLLMPTPPHPEEIYIPALSTLAKSILLQAETEVTAKKESAIPLASVAKNLLGSLPHFSDIFFAKLVQRAGGWAIPTSIPRTDVDSTPFDTSSLEKAHGYRVVDGQREAQSNYVTRVAGLMRVYFLVLIGEVDAPLAKMWQTPRYWAYFARMLGGNVALESAVAPEVLFAALDVGGSTAARIWGHQWVKMLGLLYNSVTTGSLGGTSAEGKAARVRVQLEIERIMGGLSS